MDYTEPKSTEVRMRWDVYGPVSASKTLEFLDYFWKLRFYISDSLCWLELTPSLSPHTLYVNGCRGFSVVDPPHPIVVYKKFTVEVHVVSSDSGRILPTLSQTTLSTSVDFRNGQIWHRKAEELQRASPEFEPTVSETKRSLDRPFDGGMLSKGLKFIIVFKTDDSTSSLCNSGHTTSDVPCLESLSEDFSKLFEKGSDADVEFQCAGQSTKAHGAVVSARSEVIASMLASDMIEGKTKVVKVPDMEPDIFKKFLRYLYTGKLDDLTFEVALNLFEAGDQYAVTGLAKRCSEYLVEHLSVQNACEVLVIADAHSEKGLVEKVVDYMVDKRVPLTSEVWPAFCDEHPKLSNKVLNRGWKVLLK